MSVLKVLNPKPITEGSLVYSPVTENDAPLYAGGTTYALGAVVMYGHRLYESLQASNVGHTPTETANSWWLDIGPTNKWAMFDSINSSATTYTCSGTSPLLIKLSVGVVNGVSVTGLSGVSQVKVELRLGTNEIAFSDTKALDDTFISSWYDFWFEPYSIETDLLFGPLPPYAGTVEVSIYPTTSGGTVSVAALTAGVTVELGTVQYGATAGITDYSRKETDEFGVTSLVKRVYAKRTEFTLVVDNSQLRRVYSTLAQLRATPAVWAGSDDYRFSPLVVFGYYKDFQISVAYSDFSTCTLEIEGLT